MTLARIIGLRALTSCLTLSVTLMIAVVSAYGQPVAVPPYTLTTFPAQVPSGATAPDDLAISADGADLWVAYGDGHAPDGSDGKSDNVIEYDIATGMTEPRSPALRLRPGAA